MMYQNKRNGNVAEVIEFNTKFKTVTIEENGKTKAVSLSTLKRWYTPIEVETIDVDVPDDVDVVEQAETKTETVVEQAETKTENKTTSKKSKTVKKQNDSSVDVEAIKSNIHKIAISNGCEQAFQNDGKIIVYRMNGKMLFRVRTSKKRVNMEFKTKNIGEVLADKADRHPNHLFNSHFIFTQVTDLMEQLIITAVKSVNEQ